jgi:hypothetical protein
MKHSAAKQMRASAKTFSISMLIENATTADRRGGRCSLLPKRIGGTVGLSALPPSEAAAYPLHADFTDVRHGRPAAMDVLQRSGGAAVAQGEPAGAWMAWVGAIKKRTRTIRNGPDRKS